MAQVDCKGCGAPLSPLAIRCEFCGEKVAGKTDASGQSAVAGLMEDLEEIEEAIHELEKDPRPSFLGNIYKPFYWYFALSTFGIATLFLPKPKKSGGWGKNDRASVSNIERKIDNARDLAGSDNLVRNRLKRAQDDLREVIQHRKKDKQMRYLMVALPIALLVFLVAIAPDEPLDDVESPDDEISSFDGLDLNPTAELMEQMAAQTEEAMALAAKQTEQAMELAAKQTEQAMKMAEQKAPPVDVNTKPLYAKPAAVEPKAVAPVAPIAAPVPAQSAKNPTPEEATPQRFTDALRGRWRGKEKGVQVVVKPQGIRSFGVECPFEVRASSIRCKGDVCKWKGESPGHKGTVRIKKGFLSLTTKLGDQTCQAAGLTGKFKTAKKK